MVAHVILFRLRADVSAEQRHALIDAYAAALREIRPIKRATLDVAFETGRSYEEVEQPDFPFVAFSNSMTSPVCRTISIIQRIAPSPSDSLRA
jgi:hypothetical protein